MFWRRRNRTDRRDSALYTEATSSEKLPEDMFRPGYTAAVAGLSKDQRSRRAGPDQRGSAATRGFATNSRPQVSSLQNNQPSRSYFGRAAEPNLLAAAGTARPYAAYLDTPVNPQISKVQAEESEASGLNRSGTVKSIADDQLGKGAGYASPMLPTGPDGKPIDQETFRERQRLIATGFNPNVPLTPEQQARRDSQLQTLQAQSRSGSKLSVPQVPQKGPASVPQMPQRGPMSVPETPQREQINVPQKPQRGPINAGLFLPPAAAAMAADVRPTSGPSRPAGVIPQDYIPEQAAPHTLADIIPSHPPSSLAPSYRTNAPPTQALPPTPLARASYQLYQPHQGPSSMPSPPIRASLLLPPNPVLASQMAPNRFSTASPSPSVHNMPFNGPTPHRTSYQPYTPSFDSRQSAYGLASASNTGSSGSMPRYTSVADDFYGGLTTGLSDRDLATLSYGNPNPARRYR